MKHILAVSVALAVSLLFASGCATINYISENAFLISPDQEARLGVDIAKEIEKNYRIYRADREASAYLASLGAELVAAAPPCEQTFVFEWVESDDVNAFAVPGGHCYVLLGLLREADNESELASVIAHEIGHVTERHGAKAISRSQFYGLVGSLALGQDPDKWAKLAVDIVGSGILLRHSREDELAADAVSIQTLNRAEIDPHGLPDFFQKLQSPEARFLEYFSTHPLTSSRIEKANELISELGPPSPYRRKDSPAFQELKKRYPPLPKSKTK